MRGRRVTRWRRRRTEAGYAALLVAVLVPTVFLGLAAVGVDTARWYLEAERVQVAADAAALAGVPFLPQDMPGARARALAVAARNGYDDATPDVAVTVERGTRQSQLRVTITSRITNQFGRMIGVSRTPITRSAVADFTGPAPMGSPCNVFGTEPLTNGGTSGSAIGSSRPANCPQDPEMWASVAGPQTGKVQGDRYGTVACETSGVENCSGSLRNYEYFGDKVGEEDFEDGQKGYFWLVKVQNSMVGRPLTLQLYDPAFVRTGQYCNDTTRDSAGNTVPRLPAYDALLSNMNPFATTDGKVRYAHVPSVPSAVAPTVPFCTGDFHPGSASGASNPMTTTYLLREQTDSQNPLQAPVQVSSTAGVPCAKQYGSWTSYPTFNNLRLGASGYNSQLAQVFHNWDTLCTFVPQRAGDYYLHVRTNKRYAFPSGSLVRQVPTGSVEALAGETGDATPYGGGMNSFAIRALTPPGQERAVAVSGWDRMPIFANSDAASTTFPLIRILPGAAGQTIEFEFFDAGDAATAGSVKVMLPTDARTPTGATITNPFPGGCKTWGGSATGTEASPTPLTGCTAGLVRSGSASKNNGKVQTIRIPIPTDYSCDAAVFTNCWYRVQIAFGTGDVHDVTTWNAEITGDPVRLIE